MSPPAQRVPVTAVVPVKSLDAGKSRLALPPAQRRDLAAAFALDVVSALTSSSSVAGVVVVTADPEVERLLLPLRVRVVRDAGAGLRAAVLAGVRAARSGTGLLVVPADLPYLSGSDVTKLLGRHADGFVPDRAGTGTTLLLRPTGSHVDPQYGPRSAARHAAIGLRRLEDVPPGLRHDVDCLDDLRPAPGLPLSPHTAAALQRLPELEPQAG